MDERRIVLLGKTGFGKSSLANTIFGEESDETAPFKTGDLSVSVTAKCTPGKQEINGKMVHLFDTPGFFDTRKTNDKEIKKGFVQCSPGPHAFLLLLKVERFTKQEEDGVKEMLKSFTKEALKYTTVVFTHGDQLNKGRTIKDWANENEALRNLIQKCGGRVHVFDNKYWNNSQDQYRNNQYQVEQLLNTIEQTVEENGGGYYTNEFWQRIKNVKILGIPLHILMGLMLGGIALSAVGAVAAGATVSTVVKTAAVSSVAVVAAGAGAFVAKDPMASEAAREVGSDAISAVKAGVKTLQIEGKFKML